MKIREFWKSAEYWAIPFLLFLLYRWLSFGEATPIVCYALNAYILCRGIYKMHRGLTDSSVYSSEFQALILGLGLLVFGVEKLGMPTLTAAQHMVGLYCTFAISRSFTKKHKGGTTVLMR